MTCAKAITSESELLPIDLFQALRGARDMPPLDDLGDPDAVYAAMELSKSLLLMAHELAGQAIQLSGLSSEADRIAAARRQVELTGELFEQLQAVTMGTPS